MTDEVELSKAAAVAMQALEWGYETAATCAALSKARSSMTGSEYRAFRQAALAALGFDEHGQLAAWLCVTSRAEQKWMDHGPPPATIKLLRLMLAKGWSWHKIDMIIARDEARGEIKSSGRLEQLEKLLTERDY